MAAAQPDPAPPPEVTAALDAAVPADPLALLPTVRLLTVAGARSEADDVSLLVERGVLRELGGERVRPGGTLRSAIERLAERTPPDAELRAQALATVHLRLPPQLAREAPQRTYGHGTDGYAPAGGAWTTHLTVDDGAIRVPVEVEYAGAAGRLGGLTAQMRLVPLHAGRTITLSIIDRGYSNARWKPGEPFWVGALALRPQHLGVDELIDAIQGVDDHNFRVETEVTGIWVTSSEDPRSPLLIVAAGRAAAVHDPFNQIAAPAYDRQRAASLQHETRPQVQCIAATDRAVGHDRPVPAAPPPDPDRAVLPLDSPFMRRALDRGVPANPEELLTTAALLRATNHPAEARALDAFVERTVLLELLDQPFAARGTIRALLATLPPGAGDLTALRECVAATAVGLEFPELDPYRPGVQVGGPAYTHAVGDVWSSDAAGALRLAVPVQVANASPRRLLEFEFRVRLSPHAGGETVMLKVDRTGGSAIEGRQRWQGAALLEAAAAAPAADGLAAAIEATRRGAYDVQKVGWTLVYSDADSRFRLSSRQLQWLLPADRDVTAAQLLKAADCSDTGGCAARKSGTGLASPATWIAVDLLLAGAVLVLFRGRLRWRRPFCIAYGAYWLLALGAAALALVDRPTGAGLSGVLSVGAAVYLGLPWSLSVGTSRAVIAALQSFFTNADADLITSWIGIALNQLLLGYLAFRAPKTDAG